ncbi:hypothetical protein Taro_031112 [Colocasia esculenta]|uniref:Uncharacterized protein n=1 Tax=Colocasia esculenta TaxID=4460 RepID=A0A843VP65_COLES|nr:hypothetical protein [Colocasia esculenta]
MMQLEQLWIEVSISISEREQSLHLHRFHIGICPGVRHESSLELSPTAGSALRRGNPRSSAGRREQCEEEVVMFHHRIFLWKNRMLKLALLPRIANPLFVIRSQGIPHSGCLGLFCPCFLFGKNAEFLGSGTFAGSCVMHFILWGLVNGLCCLLTEGILLGLPGSIVACYACGYRRALRSKYNLQEAPCGDLATHLFCHLCAICQEYREIRERMDTSNQSGTQTLVQAPPVQTMEPASQE